MSNTVKKIYNYISDLNPDVSTMSSMGNFVDPINKQIADSRYREILDYLPQTSLAYKIATKPNPNPRNVNKERGIGKVKEYYTSKQLWVIAFELDKNKDFVALVEEFYNKIESKENAKKQQSKQKLSANKEAAQPLLDEIKAAGKKLGDYYDFLKSNKKYKREFFSKKYSRESVNEFLGIEAPDLFSAKAKEIEIAKAKAKAKLIMLKLSDL